MEVISEKIPNELDTTDIAVYCYLSAEEEHELKTKGYLTAGKLSATGQFINLMEPPLFVQDERGLLFVDDRRVE